MGAAVTHSVDFFVSHASADREWAVWIDGLLRQAGYSTITDVYEFNPGDNFVSLMSAAIESSAQLLLVLSPRALDRRMVDLEWTFGGDGDAASENSAATANTTVAGNGTASTEPALNSGAAPAPTMAPTAESSAPLTTSVTTTVPESMPGWSGQTFGRVRALFFEPAVTFDAPDNSTLLCPPTPRHTGIEVGAGAGGPVPAGGVEAGLLVMRLSDTTVDATVATIVAGLSSATAPQPDVIDGTVGVTFDGAAPDGDAGTLYIGPQSDCTLKFDTGDLWRFWVVNVDETPVTFAVWGPSTDFERGAADLEGVVRTFEWTDAGDA